MLCIRLRPSFLGFALLSVLDTMVNTAKIFACSGYIVYMKCRSFLSLSLFWRHKSRSCLIGWKKIRALHAFARSRASASSLVLHLSLYNARDECSKRGNERKCVGNVNLSSTKFYFWLIARIFFAVDLYDLQAFSTEQRLLLVMIHRRCIIYIFALEHFETKKQLTQIWNTSRTISHRLFTHGHWRTTEKQNLKFFTTPKAYS